MSKATPGPWVVKRESGLRQRIQEQSSRGTLAYLTARPFAHGANFSHEQISANAALIAAAPALRDALRDLMSAADACVPTVGISAAAADGYRQAREQARAALAACEVRE